MRRPICRAGMAQFLAQGSGGTRFDRGCILEHEPSAEEFSRCRAGKSSDGTEHGPNASLPALGR